MVKNLVGDYYGKHMTRAEAYELFPTSDILCTLDDPNDINCQTITLYGATDPELSGKLRIELFDAGITAIYRISYENRDGFAGDFKRLEGFVGVQFKTGEI